MTPQSRPETIQEATERRLKQVEEMVAEVRVLIAAGQVPGQRELDFVRVADAALYDAVVLLRPHRPEFENWLLP